MIELCGLTQEQNKKIENLSKGYRQRIGLAQALIHDPEVLILDEPTTGLHPSDIEKLVVQLDALVEGGNTVIVVEHDMRVVAGSDWVIDIGPGAGEEGGRVVACGPPDKMARVKNSQTAPYLARFLTGK